MGLPIGCIWTYVDLAIDLYGCVSNRNKAMHGWQGTVPRGGYSVAAVDKTRPATWARNEAGCRGLSAGPVLDKPSGLVLDFRLRQGKKVCCHVV